MNSPLVTIVIPVYNRASTIVGAVESVLDQTVRDIEVIIVDNGSQDDTAERIQPFWKHVRYFFERQPGTSTALNTGFREARGEWIAVLCSDDRWLPDKLEWQCRAATRNDGQCNACFTDASYSNGEDFAITEFERANKIFPSATGIIEDATRFILNAPHGIQLPCLMFKRSVLHEIGGMDETMRMFHDADFLFRLSLVTKFAYVNKPLAQIVPRFPGSVAPHDCPQDDPDLVSLTMRQYMYEKWLRICADGEESIRNAILRQLAGVHGGWANYYLKQGAYARAMKSLRTAARLSPNAKLTVKRTVMAISPALGRKLWLHS